MLSAASQLIFVYQWGWCRHTGARARLLTSEMQFLQWKQIFSENKMHNLCEVLPRVTLFEKQHKDGFTRLFCISLEVSNLNQAHLIPTMIFSVDPTEALNIQEHVQETSLKVVFDRSSHTNRQKLGYKNVSVSTPCTSFFSKNKHKKGKTCHYVIFLEGSGALRLTSVPFETYPERQPELLKQWALLHLLSAWHKRKFKAFRLETEKYNLTESSSILNKTGNKTNTQLGFFFFLLFTLRL